MLAHQDLAQIPRDLREALSTNARNKIIFAVSPEDARVHQRHVQPNLTAHDLAHLDAFQAAAQLVVDNAITPAFTLRTRPLPPPIPGRAQAIRERLASRAAATTPAASAANPSEVGPGVSLFGDPRTRSTDANQGVPPTFRKEQSP
ncbi:hypothetical protein [Actinomadura sp. 6N118]|uniref:hypothetical protein n=1 Tax=Actinomadura sp. 6N118 TaxID=3375151 RepID=UPI0037B680DE